ncbi:MAG: hypothetical protein GY851_23950, partial [bacterium]|nr:hypothetical protein [bacterium]
VRHLDGADDFEGKITMANVVFSGGNAVITYSKSMTKKNAYNWRLQVIPIPWFYEGDKEQVYGESYLPTLEAELNAAHVARESGDVVLPKLKRPSSEARAAALTPAHVAESDQFGLVASYHFERNEGEFAFDVTGRHDLTFVAVEGWPHWADGPEGHSIQFNGKHGVLACPDAESLHFPENCFTVEALLYPTARKKHAIIVTKEHQFEVGLLDGRLKAAVRCGGEWGPGWVGNTEIPLNEWTRIAVTFDGMWLRLFVGGVLVDSALVRGRMDVTDEALVVGGSTNIGDPVFAGHIDELRIWNTVRFEATEGLGLAAGSEEPRPVGAQHQLFIDDSLIAANQGLERVVNQPAKHQANPVLTYEKPWEGNCVIAWGSVLYDETDKLFKFWYMVYKKFAKNDDPILVCYATSRDGLHWDKPDLGLVDYLGSTANNIVLWPKGDLIDAPTVIAVPDPTPECKYRMYYHGRNPNGIRTATSPDGIHWTMQDGVCIESGDRSAAYYDTERGAYCVITRVPERGIRTCGLWESKDGETFEFIGEVLAADDRDPEETQLYGMIPFNYEGIRIGFLEPFFIPTRKLNTQLAYSLDGHAWHRACDRQTFLEYGSDGSWDQAWVTPSQNPPIRVGDTLYIFYQGRQTLHWAVEPYGHIGSIGLALLRPDGFVSLDAQCAPGSVITAPLLLNGTTLHLNAVARPGSVTVDVLEESGAPVEGFTRGDCVPLENTDTLDHTVAWKHGRDLTALKGKPVRLQFHIQAAKLYSFWME